MNHDFEKTVLWSLELKLSLKPCWSAELSSISGIQQSHHMISGFEQLVCTISMAPVIAGYYSSVLGEVGGEDLALTACCPLTRAPDRSHHTALWPIGGALLFLEQKIPWFYVQMTYRVCNLCLPSPGKGH